jgi:hypothetical protein
MIRLTQKDILSMTTQERNDKLDHYEDLCCNTDYITNDIEYSIYARNVEILISKIKYNEY